MRWILFVKYISNVVRSWLITMYEWFGRSGLLSYLGVLFSTLLWLIQVVMDGMMKKLVGIYICGSKRIKGELNAVNHIALLIGWNSWGQIIFKITSPIKASNYKDRSIYINKCVVMVMLHNYTINSLCGGKALQHQYIYKLHSAALLIVKSRLCISMIVNRVDYKCVSALNNDDASIFYWTKHITVTTRDHRRGSTIWTSHKWLNVNQTRDRSIDWGCGR